MLTHIIGSDKLVSKNIAPLKWRPTPYGCHPEKQADRIYRTPHW